MCPLYTFLATNAQPLVTTTTFPNQVNIVLIAPLRTKRKPVAVDTSCKNT